jgi:nucleotide-binding universal stress UspA family protein
MSRLRRILHATDFSPASGAAFARAVAMAKAARAELLLVHVSAPQVFTANGEYIFSQKMYDDLEASARKYGQAQLESLRAKARKAGVRVKTVLLEGLADQQILRAGKSKKADLIVMGTHGRRGLAKFFLGSVASRVVAGSRCPVLTVRAR